MKKSIFIWILVILITSCSKTPDPYEPGIDFRNDKKASELISADNAFAADLFREVWSSEEEDNFMISPVSVAIALGMTYNGSDGETKSAFEETLRLNGFTRNEINRIHGELIKLLMKIDPKVTLEIANSIWVNQDYTLVQEFADTNRYYYDAEINSLNFTEPASVDIINGWVSDKTHEKIQEVLDVIPPDAVMYLINALYYYGNWKYQFDKDDNRPIIFRLEDGTRKEISGMRQEEEFMVSYQDDFSILELPYGNGNFSMVLMLPHEDQTVGTIMEQFNSENWNLWMGSLQKTELTIHIPKFKFEYKTLLNDALSDMGLGIAFTPAADFSDMVNESNSLCISRVIHKTFVDVNEKGTEAAAVTVVEIIETSAGPGTEFVIDQPFLFVIREKTSGAIVFMGKVGNPEY